MDSKALLGILGLIALFVVYRIIYAVLRNGVHVAGEKIAEKVDEGRKERWGAAATPTPRSTSLSDRYQSSGNKGAHSK